MRVLPADDHAPGAINSGNRMLIPFRTEAGNYRPGMFKNLKVA